MWMGAGEENCLAGRWLGVGTRAVQLLTLTEPVKVERGRSAQRAFCSKNKAKAAKTAS